MWAINPQIKHEYKAPEPTADLRAAFQQTPGLNRNIFQLKTNSAPNF